MMKRFVTFISVFISVWLFSVCAYANGNTLSYTVNNDGTATISGFNNRNAGHSGELVIPSEIDGYTVTGIGDYAFRKESGISKLVLPSTVSEIGDFAFESCPGLNEIQLNDGLMSIGDCAFGSCSYLSVITIPDSVTDIGEMAFCKCFYLSCVSIGTGITEIDDYVFSNCTNLNTIYIPDSVLSVGENAFEKVFSCDVFYNGSREQWDSISFEKGNEMFLERAYIYMHSDSMAYEPEIIEETVFSYEKNSDSTITVTGINAMSSYMQGELEIPSEIEGCTVVKIGDGCFKNMYDIINLKLPDTVTKIGNDAFSGCGMLTGIEFGKGLIIIGDRAFSNCPNLTVLNLSDNVEKIGNNAFEYCNSLREINFNRKMTHIGEYAFNGCRNLKTVVLGENIFMIGTHAFHNCKIVNLYIPKSVSEIGAYAFSALDYDTVVNYDGTKADWQKINKNYGNTFNRCEINYTSDKDGISLIADKGTTTFILTIYGFGIVAVIAVISVVLICSDKKCKACGHKAEKGSRFCPNCGKKL